MRQSIYSLLLVLSFSYLIAGCAITKKYGVYSGKVVDADTLEPLEGVVVFMECMTRTGNLGGSKMHFADAMEVLTDKNGEFEISLRITTFRLGHLWEEYPDFIFFKPGYGVFPGHKKARVEPLIRDTSHHFSANTPVTIFLPRLTTIEERIENQRDAYIPSGVPLSKRLNLYRLRDIERVQIGLEPFEKQE